MNFIEKGRQIRTFAKQIVLNYMVNVTYDFELKQAEIFNNLNFGWGNQKNATSTHQQYWIVALLKQLEDEGFIQQNEFTLYWTTTEKVKQLKNNNDYKIKTIETLKDKVSLLKNEAIELVLTYMTQFKNENKNISGFQQAYLFRQCGFDFGNYDRAESRRQQYWVIGLLRHLENEGKVFRDERKRWKLFSEKTDKTIEDTDQSEIREILKTKEIKEAFGNIIEGLCISKNKKEKFMIGMHQLFALYSFKTKLSFNCRDVLTEMLVVEDERQGYCFDKAIANIKDILNNIVCQLCFPTLTNLNLFNYKKAKLTLDDFDSISKSLASCDYPPFPLVDAIQYLMSAFIKIDFYLNDVKLCEKAKIDISTFRNDLHIILSKYFCAGIGTPGKKNLDENEFDEYEDDDEEE